MTIFYTKLNQNNEIEITVIISFIKDHSTQESRVYKNYEYSILVFGLDFELNLLIMAIASLVLYKQ